MEPGLTVSTIHKAESCPSVSSSELCLVPFGEEVRVFGLLVSSAGDSLTDMRSYLPSGAEVSTDVSPLHLPTTPLLL